MLTGVDVMMASRRGGPGFDYYTLAYDDPDEQYEEDSIPGMGSGGSGSPSAYGFSSNKLPPGKYFLNISLFFISRDLVTFFYNSSRLITISG